MTTETKAKHEKRGALVTQMQAILDTAKADGNRSLTKEEDILWSKLDTEQEALAADIRRIEKIAELTGAEKERFLQLGKDNGTSQNQEEDTAKQYEKAFINYLKRGFANLPENERKVMQAVKSRAYQNVGTTTEGGYLVPEGFMAELQKSLLKFGGVRESGARILRTSGGNDIPWPNMNDTANSAAILGESSAALTSPDLVFGSTTLKSWMYVTSVIRASYQLLNDSAIDVRSIVIDALAERIARGTNAGFTTGNGTTAPEGVVTGAGAGKTTASETAITSSEIVDLEHSVDAAYRPGAKFMMHDSVLKKVKQLVLSDAANTPIWQPGIMNYGMPSTILGYEYVVNNDMASSLVADAKVMLFGNFSTYVIRDVQDFSVLNLKERYAEYLQEGFIGYSRHDGRYVSSDDSVKYMVMVNT